MAGEPVGFLSYVHADDEDDHGRILAFAKDLESAYRLQTGERLSLFVDREDVEWGAAWKERIDNAIAGTTFFIPIITPSYFKSPECRRELLKFAREAEALGLTELLASVYWIRVPALQDAPEASQDEAVRLVAKYNWQNFRDERLEERESSPYRKALSKLAEKLEDRAQQAEQVEDVPMDGESLQASAVVIGGTEQRTSAEEEPTDGVLDHLAGAEEAMPDVGALLTAMAEDLAKVGELTGKANEDLDAAAKRGQGAKAALTVTNRLAHELAEPAAAIAVTGREYGQVLVAVDLGVQAQLNLIEEGGQPSEDEVQVLREIQGLMDAAAEMEHGLKDMLDSMEPASKLSRSLKAPLAEMKAALLGVLDGNAVIEEWGRRAKAILEAFESEAEETGDLDPDGGS